MPNTILSPSMHLPVPVVSVDPGPDWATNVNACFGVIDSHNHSPGQGVQINPAGIDINSDLLFNGNNATLVNSVNFAANASPLSGAANNGAVYVSGVDLWYNDENGNQVRITASGSVNAGAGSITGLPSGTASASFGANTFTWQSATNTPAFMAVGPLIIGAHVANSNTVTLSPTNSLAASYDLVLPTALPASTSITAVDASGNMSLIAPDNSTFGVTGGQYAVLPGGVTNTQLAPVNIQAGSTSGYSQISASLTNVPGLSVTLSALGTRPVMVMFTSTSSSTPGFITAGGGIITIEVVRNGTAIGSTNVETGPLIPTFTLVDLNPASGSNNYVVRIASDNVHTASVVNVALYVWEL